MAHKLSRNKRKVMGTRIKPKEGMWINYRLKLQGLTHQNLADKLGVRRETITKVIRGIGRSARIEEALYIALGFSTFEAMINASRKGESA